VCVCLHGASRACDPRRLSPSALALMQPLQPSQARHCHLHMRRRPHAPAAELHSQARARLTWVDGHVHGLAAALRGHGEGHQQLLHTAIQQGHLQLRPALHRTRSQALKHPRAHTCTDAHARTARPSTHKAQPLAGVAGPAPAQLTWASVQMCTCCGTPSFTTGGHR